MTLQFIYRLSARRPAMLSTGPTTAEAQVLSAHSTYLEQLTEQGQVLLAGRTQTTHDQTFGIVILQASDEAQARQLMRQDPAVAGGVMSASLFPFQIAMLSKEIGT